VRTLDEVINQADELVGRFEEHEPDVDAIQDATALREIRVVLQVQAEVERRMTEVAKNARTAGHSWTAIGAMLGTSGDSARQEYGETNPNT
jgi:hypothetical protein